MQRQAGRPVGTADRKSAREARDEGKEQRGHPRAGQDLVDEWLAGGDRFAVRDGPQILVSKEQQPDGGEKREDRQPGLEALHGREYSRAGETMTPQAICGNSTWAARCTGPR